MSSESAPSSSSPGLPLGEGNGTGGGIEYASICCCCNDDGVIDDVVAVVVENDDKEEEDDDEGGLIKFDVGNGCCGCCCCSCAKKTTNGLFLTMVFILFVGWLGDCGCGDPTKGNLLSRMYNFGGNERNANI